MSMVQGLVRFSVSLIWFVLMLPLFALQLYGALFEAVIAGIFFAVLGVCFCALLGIDPAFGFLWGPPVALIVLAESFHRNFIRGEG